MISAHCWAGLILFFLFIAAVPCAAEGAEWYQANQELREYKFLSPATLKRGTKMNWVGCVLTWLAPGIVSPVMFVYKCIYNLFHI
jgi:hypothetical protein